MKTVIPIQRFPDGTFVDWGRHGYGKHKGVGGASAYSGEAAKVMALVVQHSQAPSEPG